MARPSPSATADRPVHPAAIGCAVTLGGMAALSWEVLWQTQVDLALGISALGTALTLAATMAGMTIGALSMGRRLQRQPSSDPLWLYGRLELVIGVSGMVMLPGFGLLQALDTSLYPVSPQLAPIAHILGVLLLLGPPTLAMGATVPVFRLVADRHGASISRLYGLNTAGAAIGVLLLTFVLLPPLGIAATTGTVVGLNLLVGGTVWALSRRARSASAAPASTTPAAPTPGPGQQRSTTTAPSPASAQGAAASTSAETGADAHAGRVAAASQGADAAPSLAVAGLMVCVTGLVTFGLEIAWFRAMRAAFWSTSGSFAVILASVLIPLALGARLVPTMRRRGLSPGFIIGLAGAAILLATPLVERLDLLAAFHGEYYEILGRWLGVSLLIIGPAITLLGMALPWCMEQFTRPGEVGRLYGLNTVGAVIGSLVTAWWLLPLLGFARASWLLGGLTILVGLATSAGRRRQIVFMVGLPSLLIAVLQTSSPGRDRIHGHKGFRRFEVLAMREGPDSTVTVLRLPNGKNLLMVDGFGATGEQGQAHYMQWMGRLPALLHDDPSEGLVICFGTGQTANAVRSEGIESLDVVELSPAVLELAPLFRSNEGVLNDERVHPTVMDGRAWLRRVERTYDVITLEPMPPTFAGVNALYSREFYELASDRLADGGIIAQWLPVHLVDSFLSPSIAATFMDVFPNAGLWIDPPSGTGILLARAGDDDRPLGSEWPGLKRPSAPRTLTDSQIKEALLLGPELLARYAAQGRVITDDNQLLTLGQLHAGSPRKLTQIMEADNLNAIVEIVGHEVPDITEVLRKRAGESGGTP